jgi:N-acetyltransferase 10
MEKPKPSHSDEICMNMESSHRKKRMRQLKKMALKGLIEKESENPFELFMSSTQVWLCYCAETH